jgi:hypothetical protein
MPPPSPPVSPPVMVSRWRPDSHLPVHLEDARASSPPGLRPFAGRQVCAADLVLLAGDGELAAVWLDHTALVGWHSWQVSAGMCMITGMKTASKRPGSPLRL